MKFDFLAVTAKNAFSLDLLKGKLLEAINTWNDLELIDIENFIEITEKRDIRPARDEFGESYERIVFGFSVNLEDIENPKQVIREFLDQVDEFENLVKFYDETVIKENKEYLEELYRIEMKIRKAISLIYISNSDNDFYNLLDKEAIETAKDKPSDQELKSSWENEFFYLLFSDYVKLNSRKLPSKVSELISILTDSRDFDNFRNNLTSQPISYEDDQDLIAALKTELDYVEKLRNCIAHNRTPSKRISETFERNRTSTGQIPVEDKVDFFLKRLNPDSESVDEV
jgi:hypothetical protein